MKKYTLFTFSMLAAVAGMTISGCTDDREALGGEGTLSIKTSISSKVEKLSRADVQDELAEQCDIWIFNSKGAVRHFEGISNVPSSIALTAGTYKALAWTGDSVSASWDKQWYKGEVPFNVEPGQQTQVNLVCKIANVVVSINYDDDIDYMLSDYSVTVGHRRGNLTFENKETRKGYFMMPSNDKDLAWTLTGTKADGTIFTRTGVITNAKPAYEYVLNIKHSGVDVEVGGGFFTIEVDENPIEEISTPIIISLPPKIEAYNFDINEPQYGQPGNFTQKSIFISASSSLESVLVECPGFGDLLGIGGDDFDIISMSSSVKAKVESAGITSEYNYDAENDQAGMKINFAASLLNKLPKGEYPIRITVVDGNHKTSTATLLIVASDASITAVDMPLTDINCYSATLSGSVLKDDVDVESVGFNMRKKGTQAVTFYPADTVDGQSRAAGTVFSATVSDLEANTTYEYWAVCSNFVSPAIKEFTTNRADQLPNAGFENWQGSKPTLAYGSGEQMFWDTGNHGSKTAGSDITTPSSDYKHSGNYSAKLESKSLFGVIAAGNIFTGEYLATVGTNGVLGFGRPWQGAMPKALRGWCRYTPKTVTNAKTNPEGMAKGDMDKGAIYIALLDESTQSYNGKNYPFIIKTSASDQSLFSKDAPNVIAYGTKIFTEDFGGDGMAQFEIPIDYYRPGVKPSYILVVCSASKNGDFFTGGPSVMYLDDFELVYE